MTELDEIEAKWKMDSSNDALASEDISYLLKVARKAEEMANQVCAVKFGADIGLLEKAREFLSFLEKGPE